MWYFIRSKLLKFNKIHQIIIYNYKWSCNRHQIKKKKIFEIIKKGSRGHK
jgi:hypothetical protein